MNRPIEKWDLALIFSVGLFFTLIMLMIIAALIGTHLRNVRYNMTDNTYFPMSYSINSQEVKIITSNMLQQLPKPKPIIVQKPKVVLPQPASVPTIQQKVISATCEVSWYGAEFNGKKTASGEIFNENLLTAAHRTLPFGTKLRVYYGNKSVEVKINDRGPFGTSRCLDLSRAAFSTLASTGKGVITIQYEIL